MKLLYQTILTISLLVIALLVLPAQQATGQQIMKGEYFVNTDPGFGKATPFAFTAGEDVTNAAFNFRPDALADGFHRLYVRFRNEAGVWSHTNYRTFYKQLIPPATQANIVRGEAFVDNDPGFGKGHLLTVSQQNGELVSGVAFGMNDFPEGFHRVSTRFVDANGVWSHTNYRYFYKQIIPEDPTLPKIVEFEYFIDFDPGIGLGKKVPIPAGDQSNNVDNILFEPDLTGVEVGVHKLYIRAKNNAGKWSITQVSDFKIDHPTGHLVELGKLPDYLCEAGALPIPYTLNAPFDVNNTFYAELSDANGKFDHPKRIGEKHGNQAGVIDGKIPMNAAAAGANYRIRVVSTLPRDTSEESEGIQLYRKPGVFGITGDTITCLGNYQYGLWNGSGNHAEYTWTLSSGGTMNVNNSVASINWNESGIHTLKVKHEAICANDDSVKVIEIDAEINPMQGTFRDNEMIPADGETSLSVPITFSWSPIANTVTYDLYIWPVGEERPATPLVSGLTSINYLYKNENNFLKYEKSYHWKVIAKRACHTVESRDYEFRLLYLPNLDVTEVTVPPSVFSEEVIQVNWKVKNIGMGPANNQAWSDLVYLSLDRELDPSVDYYLGASLSTTAVGKGETYSGTGTFTVPVGLNGPYFVYVVANGLRSMPESNHNDNGAASTEATDVKLTPPPDLQVLSAIGPNTAFSGQEIDVTWKIANKGTGPMRVNHWFDNIYISPDNSTDLTNAIKLVTTANYPLLDVDKESIRRQNMRLPNGISGKYYFIIQADAQGGVYEHSKENNNLFVGNSVDIILAPSIDMEPVSVEAPLFANNKDRIKVKWKVQNKGGASTTNRSWSDQIYLSKDPVFNKDQALAVCGAGMSHVVLPQAFYNVEDEFTVPESLNGEYYVFLFTDCFNSLYEHNTEDNNVLQAVAKITIGSPNLGVEDVILPAKATAATPMLVKWKIKNRGDGKLYSQTINDRIYISLRENFVLSECITLGDFRYTTGDIAAGAAIEKEFEFLLPQGIQDHYYVYVTTDMTKNVTEPAGEEDNTTRSADKVEIALAPWGDLAVMEVGAPAAVQAGSMMNLIYKVMNKRDFIKTTRWSDNAYLSKEPVWDPAKAVYLRNFPQNRSMLKNEEYGSTVMVKCPPQLSAGTYYLYLAADYNNELFEHTNEENNIRRSDAIEITAYPPVDLSMLTVSGPVPAQNATRLKLEWAVKNVGQNPPVYDQWNDGVYLSLNETYDENDILVGDAIRSGTLNPGEQYAKELELTLPRTLKAGIYNIIVVTDHNNSQQDNNLPNNWKLSRQADGSATQLHIRRNDPADLIPVFLTTQPSILAGQAPKIKWKVLNNGTGTTSDKYWTDRVYLSADQTWDGADIQLGITSQRDSLKAGEFYEDSLTESIIPLTAKGNYYLLLKIDATDRIYENLHEHNNEMNVAITVINPEKCDLRAGTVTVPDTVRVGHSFNVEYMIQNNSSSAVDGKMRIGYYLSRDQVKDPSDIFIMSESAHTGIGAGKEKFYRGEMNMKGATGNYFVLVDVDLQNNIPETNEGNNVRASEQMVYVKVDSLIINEYKDVVQVNAAEYYYRINVPEELDGESLMITASTMAGGGDQEIYVKYGEIPTAADHDYAHQYSLSRDQELMIPEMREGTYYVMVQSRMNRTHTQTAKIGVHVRYFEIRKAETNKGGNTGNVTVKISGSKFEDGMNIQLRNSSGTITATTVKYIDQSLLYATFPLNGATTGLYHLVAKKESGEEAKIENGFTVEAGKQSVMMISVKHPSSVRIFTNSSMQVEFSNDGNVDIPLTTRQVISQFKAPLGFNIAMLEDNTPGLSFRLLDSREPLTVLRPGARGTITLFMKATNRLKFSMHKPE